MREEVWVHMSKVFGTVKEQIKMLLKKKNTDVSNLEMPRENHKMSPINEKTRR